MTVRRASGWLGSKLARPARVAGTPLSIVLEADALRPTHDAAGPRDRPPPPGVLERAIEGVVPGDTAERFSVAAGPALPDWARLAGDAVRYAVDLARVSDVHHAPGFGAVIDREGRVFRSPVGGATYFTPTLHALPQVRLRGGVAYLSATGDEPRRAAASIFVPWGALYNYGHFLLDALPSLVLLADRGLLERFPAIAPPLEFWQRDMLRLVLRAGESVAEVEAALLHVDDLLFCSSMDHFLHGPNAPLDSVRRRMSAAVPPDVQPSVRRLYLTRRFQTKRVMVNESELEAALVERGFVVISPEHLSVARQIDLFRSAEIVVSATGAALSNVLFVQPNAMIFEIQPSNYLGIWVRALAQFVEARWYGFFCQSPLKEARVKIGGRSRPELLFRWSLPLTQFLAFLDDHIGEYPTAPPEQA